MTDKKKPKAAKPATGKPATGKPAPVKPAMAKIAKPQPYKGPPSNKADHAAFKRIDKNVMIRMRVK